MRETIWFFIYRIFVHILFVDVTGVTITYAVTGEFDHLINKKKPNSNSTLFMIN